MKYRNLIKNDTKLSILGFGCMRFPILGAYDKIDEKQANAMIKRSLDLGINYFDTAYPYHNGNSEIVLGRALKDVDRESISIATKMPTWMIHSQEEMDKYFSEQLHRLQTDYIDYYLIHALTRKRWDQMLDTGIIAWIDKQKQSGAIRHIGFSFHDEYNAFTYIIDSCDKWEFCQIQYNYLDENFQAGTKGVEYAYSKGLGIVIMEPLLGGKLAQTPPFIQKIWDKLPTQKTSVDRALLWLWNKKEVSIVLSGMSTMEQLEQNCATADQAEINSLSDEELDAITKARTGYESIKAIPCTNCRYCLPCPSNVKIPDLFSIYNEGIVFNDMDNAHSNYYMSVDEENRAHHCTECGACETNCPQSIEIIEWLKKINQIFN